MATDGGFESGSQEARVPFMWPQTKASQGLPRTPCVSKQETGLFAVGVSLEMSCAEKEEKIISFCRLVQLPTVRDQSMHLLSGDVGLNFLQG